MPTAELIANFRSTCLSQLDFDDVRFFGIGRKHNFFDVRRNSAFVSKWKGKLMKRGKRKQVKRWNLRNWNVAVFRQWGRYRWCSRCSSLYNGNSRHTFIDKNLPIQSYSINRLLIKETNKSEYLSWYDWLAYGGTTISIDDFVLPNLFLGGRIDHGAIHAIRGVVRVPFQNALGIFVDNATTVT